MYDRLTETITDNEIDEMSGMKHRVAGVSCIKAPSKKGLATSLMLFIEAEQCLETVLFHVFGWL